MKIDKQRLKDKLLAEFNECQTPGWDSYNARPVSQEEYDRFLTLIDSLPTDIDHPDLGPIYDGTFEMEWGTEKGAALVFWDDTKWCVMSYDKEELRPCYYFESEFPEELYKHLKKIQ